MSRFQGVLGGLEAKRGLSSGAMGTVAGRVNERQAAINAMVHPAARVDDVEVTPERAREGLPQVEAMAAAEGARSKERALRQQTVDEAYQYGQQYLNDPREAKGRARMGRQFWEAPLGGHVRRGLEGQEIFGHTIDAGQARTAEQALAGLTAVGIGVPTFLAAVNNLSTPQTQETIPL